MQRRSFLRAALAAVAGLLGLAYDPRDYPPPEDRVPVHRWDGKRWCRVRFHALQEGDIIRHGEWETPFRVAEGPRPVVVNGKPDWHIFGVSCDDPSELLQPAAGV